MNRRIVFVTALCAAMPVAAGCTRTTPRVDLDGVLEVFEASLKQPTPGDADSGATQDVTPTRGSSGGQVLVKAIDPSEQQAEVGQAFLQQFATNLNVVPVYQVTLGARQDESGAIIGFTDRDSNMRLDPDDRDLFKIQIDPERNRLIATDLMNPNTHRDRSYHNSYRRYHYGGGFGGFYMGYMLGSMMGSQRGYYSRSSRRRPDFGRMNMAPQGYARKRTSNTRSSRSARSRGGSRGFRGGK